MPNDQQAPTWARRLRIRGPRFASVLAGALVLGAIAWAGPAQAVANPVHAVAASAPSTTRFSNTQITFNPTPAGSVNAIDFQTPADVTILDATGCESTASLPTSTYHCVTTPGFSFTSPITLSLTISSAASAGSRTGSVDVYQTDGTKVSDNWFMLIQDVQALQASVPVTANGSAGTTTFNPKPSGGLIYALTFVPPSGVTITGVTGCTETVALPAPGPLPFTCVRGEYFISTPITLTYSVNPGAPVNSVLTGSVIVGQSDGTNATTDFLVRTPLGATKVSAVHTPQPSTYGQSSTVKVTVARDGSVGSAPTGTVQVLNAAGVQVASGALFDGAATFTLPGTTAVGTQTLTVRYLGSETLAASEAPLAVTVNKAATKTKGTPSTKTPAYKADFKVKVTVTATGVQPAGKVRISYKGMVIGKGKVKGGKATITIKKDLKVGKRKLVVKYLGSALTLGSTGKVLVTIVKA